MKSIFVNGMIFLILQVSLSSCFDFAPDFSGIMGSGWGGGSYYGGNYNYYPIEYVATFGIDSVVQETDTTFTIWAYITYDSTLIINQRTLRIYEAYNGNGSTSEILQSEPDTIDFKSLTDSIYTWRGRYEQLYQYSVSATIPDSATVYTFCLDTELTEKGVTKMDYQCRGY